MCLYNENTRAERSIPQGRTTAPPWEQLWVTGLGLTVMSLCYHNIFLIFFQLFFFFIKVILLTFGSDISLKTKFGSQKTIIYDVCMCKIFFILVK